MHIKPKSPPHIAADGGVGVSDLKTLEHGMQRGNAGNPDTTATNISKDGVKRFDGIVETTVNFVCYGLTVNYNKGEQKNER